MAKTEPGHRYTMEELLNAVPLNWRKSGRLPGAPTGSRSFFRDRKMQTFSSSHHVYQKEDGWYHHWGGEANAPYLGPLPTHHEAMAAADDWFEEHYPDGSPDSP